MPSFCVSLALVRANATRASQFPDKGSRLRGGLTRPTFSSLLIIVLFFVALLCFAVAVALHIVPAGCHRLHAHNSNGAKAKDKQRYVAIGSSSFSGRRNPTSTYGIPLPPFGPSPSNTPTPLVFRRPLSVRTPFQHLPHPPSPPCAVMGKLVAGPGIRMYISLAS